MKALVTRKGRITIPVELRRKYGIMVGSTVKVEDTGKGFFVTRTPSPRERRAPTPENTT